MRRSLLYPSYFKLHVRWPHSFTPVTYQSKLPGIRSLAAFLQLELFRVYTPLYRERGSRHAVT
ncbi:hypothetical protein DDJ70_08220 [Klebsiella michiganensis]|nr:hypothetical protein DDJ70_08220 [Klebsiella michiganensis]TXV09000.1 hypothetical protein D4M92_00225 [Klebsiella michiganensis]